MVSLPGLRTPHSITMDVLLSANKADTRHTRDPRRNHWRHDSRPGSATRAGNDDSRNASESSFPLVFRIWPCAVHMCIAWRTLGLRSTVHA